MKWMSIIMCVLLLAAACTSQGTQATGDIDMSEDEDGPSETDLDPELHGTEPADNTNVPAFAGGNYDIASSDVEYVNGVTGYYAAPTIDGDYPGVIMIHEWWGLNDHIKTMANTLASQGYRVLAVDLFGTVADTPQGARENVMNYDSEAGVENMQAAIAYLEQQGAQRIGSLGWCFGGGQSLQLAIASELDAMVMYYGNVETDANVLASVQEPVLGIFASEDGGIPVSSVQEFDGALDAVGTMHSVHIYEGVDHAFANPSGNRYAANEAQDAWEKTTAFLAQNLAQTQGEKELFAEENIENVVEFTVTGENFAFFIDEEKNPDMIVNKGDTVRITFESTSGFHDWVIDEFDAATTKVRPEDGTTTVEFVANQAGEYEYYCSVDSHRANGMKGLFIVE